MHMSCTFRCKQVDLRRTSRYDIPSAFPVADAIAKAVVTRAILITKTKTRTNMPKNYIETKTNMVF